MHYIELGETCPLWQTSVKDTDTTIYHANFTPPLKKRFSNMSGITRRISGHLNNPKPMSVKPNNQASAGRGSLRPACCADGVILTQHALERYMERCRATKVMKSLNRIERMAARAIRIGQNRFYADGWILKVAHGEIVTMFKPKHARDLKQIYRAMNPHNDRTELPARVTPVARNNQKL